MNGTSGPSSSSSSFPTQQQQPLQQQHTTSTATSAGSEESASSKPTNPFAAIIAQQKTGHSASSEDGGASALHQQQQQGVKENAHKNAQARDPFELAELEASLAQGNAGGSGRVAAKPGEPSQSAESVREGNADEAAREIEQPDSPDSERGDPIQQHSSSNQTASTAAPTEASGSATSSTEPTGARPGSISPPLARYAPPSGPPPDDPPARSSNSNSSQHAPPPRHPSVRMQSSSSSLPSSRISQHAPSIPPTSPPRSPGALLPSPTSPAVSSSRPLTTLPPNYHPTTVPTPGQPLLSSSQLLLYPLNTTPCAKCRGTGYKRADPMHPCRRCWEKFGRNFAAIRDGRVDLRQWSLQAPLPFLGGHHHSPAMSPGAGAPMVTYGWGPGPSGPGTIPIQAPLSPSTSSHYTHGAAPHSTAHSGTTRPPRRGPPRVERSSQADEALDDPDGEAPPSYEAAVSTTAPLPPQRPGSSSHAQSEAPPSRPGGDANVQGGYRPSQSHGAPPQQHHGPLHGGYPGAQYQHQQQNWQQHGHHGAWNGGPAPHVMTAPAFGHPPPGALVVRPGDPRLGGTMCTKCFGEGETESFWFGSETCTRCGGIGRLFQQR